MLCSVVAGLQDHFLSMAAVGVSSGAGLLEGGEEDLLDLSFLTEEERDKIRAVLKEDEALRTRDRIRLG